MKSKSPSKRSKREREHTPFGKSFLNLLFPHSTGLDLVMMIEQQHHIALAYHLTHLVKATSSALSDHQGPRRYAYIKLIRTILYSERNKAYVFKHLVIQFNIKNRIGIFYNVILQTSFS